MEKGRGRNTVVITAAILAIMCVAGAFAAFAMAPSPEPQVIADTSPVEGQPLAVQGKTPQQCYDLSDRLLIDSPEALSNFFALLENNDFSGKSVYLRDDYVIGDYTSTSGTKAFSGKFYGQDHVLSGGRFSSGSDSNAMFARVSGAEICDLRLEGCRWVAGTSTNYGLLVGSETGGCRIANCSIDGFTFASTSSKSSLSVGGFVGCSTGSISFESCTGGDSAYSLSVSNSGMVYAGGFAGNLSGQSIFSDCTVHADMNAYVSGSDGVYVGGAAGYAECSIITDSVSDGEMSCSSSSCGDVRTGGFFGAIGLDTTVSSVSNHTSIHVTSIGSADLILVGGIAGESHTKIIVGCENDGTVRISASDAEVRAGGLVGSLAYDGGIYRLDANSGNILVDMGVLPSGSVAVGGLFGEYLETSSPDFGYLSNSGNITVNVNNSYSGSIFSGGVFGICNSVSCPQSSGSYGNIDVTVPNTSNVFTGGIAGSMDNAAGATMTSCYAPCTVKVNGSGRDAGFAGRGTVTPNNSYYLSADGGIMSWSMFSLDDPLPIDRSELFLLLCAAEDRFSVWYMDSSNGGYPYVTDSGVTETIRLNGGSPLATPSGLWIETDPGVYRSTIPAEIGYLEFGPVIREGYVLRGIDRTVSDNSITLDFRWGVVEYRSSAEVQA